MPTKTRDELDAEKLEHVKAAREIASKAEAEDRNLTAEERVEVMGYIEKAKSAHDEILALDGDTAIRDELNILGRPTGELARLVGKASAGKGQTLGEKFASAPELAAWMKSIAPSGRIPESAKGLQSPAIEFGMKDLVTGGSVTSAGALVTPDNLGLLDGLGQFQRVLTLADLVTRGTTGSDTVEYARVTGFTNNASTVPEAVSDAVIGTGSGETTGVLGGLKPKSGLALEKKTASVKTIAHWLPATKRSLSDAGQIRTLIDSFLNYGLNEELEDQMLLGAGADEDFDGILNTDGVQEFGFDSDLLTTSRKARTLVRTVGRARPTAYVFHPNDNERIDLTTNSNGDFYFGGPTSNPSAPLWGLPRVECEAMPEGVGAVADWRQAVLWDREQAGIQVSDSHADFFVRNLVAILAEMRAAFGVIRPKAFVFFDMVAGS